MWLAYCAMAAAIVPLVLMGIGYFFVGRTPVPPVADDRPVATGALEPPEVRSPEDEA